MLQNFFLHKIISDNGIPCQNKGKFHKITKDITNYQPSPKKLNITPSTEMLFTKKPKKQKDQNKYVMNQFHSSLKLNIAQCEVCNEAWFSTHKLKSNICLRCLSSPLPKKFSILYHMIPLVELDELCDHSESEEMLRALHFLLCKCIVKKGVANVHIRGMC